MRKFNLVLSIFVLTLLVSGVAGASMMIPASDRAKEKARAPEKSSAIGENWELERGDFIHYAKPENPGKSKPPKTESCYKLLGIKWKEAPVDYVINPTNSEGLTDDFVIETVANSFEAWDDQTSLELINDAFGVDYTAQYGVQNYENAVVFGDYPNDGVIGVTSIWYTRRGKKIVEFDILLNTRFDWGDSITNPGLMDLQNIATHEFGHAVGMGDIYSDTCSVVTMYGYSTEGEISKRTLEAPDITGLQQMYGS